MELRLRIEVKTVWRRKAVEEASTIPSQYLWVYSFASIIIEIIESCINIALSFLSYKTGCLQR